MPLFRSSRTQAQVAFVIVTALAAAGSVVLLALAPRWGALAEEAAIVPMLLTTWIGAAAYRRRFGGRRWWPRVGKAMATAGAIGGIVAVVALTSWGEWPTVLHVLLWAVLVFGGAAVWATVAVVLLWLSDRRPAIGHPVRDSRRRRSARRSRER
jgi:hypothetical protein